MLAEPQRHFNQVVGIDLGGGKGKHTAVAVGCVKPAGLEIQSYGTRSPDGTPWYDEVLCTWLLGLPERTLVAVDAPLGLPACVRCRLPVCPGLRQCPDPAVLWMMTEGMALERGHRHRPRNRKPLITPYTQRVCEILLRCERKIQPRETLGQGMGPLTARAAHLVKALASRYVRDHSLIEVYPRAVIHEAAGPDVAARYKRGTGLWGVRARLLEGWSRELSFETWREESLRCDHSFDAVVCALAAYQWMTHAWSRPAAYDDIAALEGWIWLPHEREPGSDVTTTRS